MKKNESIEIQEISAEKNLFSSCLINYPKNMDNMLAVTSIIQMLINLLCCDFEMQVYRTGLSHIYNCKYMLRTA